MKAKTKVKARVQIQGLNVYIVQCSYCNEFGRTIGNAPSFCSKFCSHFIYTSQKSPNHDFKKIVDTNQLNRKALIHITKLTYVQSFLNNPAALAAAAAFATTN